MDKSALSANTGSNISQIRNYRNITQDKLAEIVGSNRVVIARIESGKTIPSLDFVNKIANALDAEIDITIKPISSNDAYSTKNVEVLTEYVCVNCNNRWPSKLNRPVIQCPVCHKQQGVPYKTYDSAYNAIHKIISDVKDAPPGKKAPPIRSIKNNAPAIFKLIRETAGSTFPSPQLPFRYTG